MPTISIMPTKGNEELLNHTNFLTGNVKNNLNLVIGTDTSRENIEIILYPETIKNLVIRCSNDIRLIFSSNGHWAHSKEGEQIDGIFTRVVVTVEFLEEDLLYDHDLNRTLLHRILEGVEGPLLTLEAIKLKLLTVRR